MLNDSKGQLNIAAVAIATLVFLIVLTVYGQVYATQTNSGLLNGGQYGSGVPNLLALIPLVLVGAAIIGIIVVAFRIAM